MMRLLTMLLVFTLSGIQSTCNDPKQSDIYESIWKDLAKEFPQICSNPEKYELQIKYTQIVPTENNSVIFVSHDFRVDDKNYFYPASTVKMPVAFLALEKLERIQSEGYEVTIDTPIRFGAGTAPQKSFEKDPTAKDELVTLRHLINRVFVISDNNAYNRLYEFVGRDVINQSMKEKGLFEYSRIITRVGISGFDYDSNAFANAFEFYEGDKVIYQEEERRSTEDFRSSKLKNTTKGKGFMTDEERIVFEAFDMGEKNFYNINDLEGSLMRLMYPENFSPSAQYQLNKKHLAFLRKSMARLPREHQYPIYDTEEYYDGYVKFFLYGDDKEEIPDHIRIFNKVGYAYGTLTDCAMVVDQKYNIAFFLTASILVNENQIFNDGEYEYDDLGIPFLAALGRKIYEYELTHPGKKLDLSRFRFDFKKEGRI